MLSVSASHFSIVRYTLYSSRKLNFLTKLQNSENILYKLVEKTPVIGRRTDPGMLPTGYHYVGKPSATGQPTRPTHPFILPGSINE